MKDNGFSLSRLLPSTTTGVPELFDEARILADLQRVRGNPSLLGQYFGALRSRFTSRREVELINQWAAQYKAGAQLIQAKTGVMRAATEYHGLERENLQKSAETEATIAKHQADQEEQITRAAKAKAERKRLEMDQPSASSPADGRILPEHQEQSDRYRSRRALDRKHIAEEQVFGDTMSLLELQRAYKKGLLAIDNEPMTAKERKEARNFLEQRYRDAVAALEGRGGGKLFAD